MSASLRARRLLFAAALVGLLARAAFAFLYWVDQPLTVDQVEYLLLAERATQGEGLTYPPGERRLMRSPGYPLFLAAVRLVSTEQAAIRAVQCLLGAFAVLQVAAIGLRLAGERAAVAAAWLAALYPPLVFEPAYVLSEVLYTVLALACVTAACDALETADPRRRGRSVVGAGVLGGAVLLVRPEFALFVGLMGLVLLIRRHLPAAVLLGVTATAVVLPWPAYNILAHDRVILMSSRGGPNFWMGNNALAIGDGDVASNPAMAHEYLTIIEGNPELSPDELEKLFYRRSVQFIREQPLQWASLLVKKVFWFVVPFGPSYQSRSPLFWAT